MSFDDADQMVLVGIEKGSLVSFVDSCKKALLSFDNRRERADWIEHFIESNRGTLSDEILEYFKTSTELLTKKIKELKGE